MKEHIRILVLSSRGHKLHSETLAGRRGSDLLPGQTVQIGGAGEEFVVLRVDRERRVADLLRKGSVSSVETGIPLMLLTLLSDPAPTDEVQISA